MPSEKALEIARAVNTPEVEFLVRSKHAAGLDSLRSHRFIDKLDSTIGLEWSATSNAFSAKGYDVRLVLTSDQTQYTLTILPKPEQWKSGALPAYIRNESGLIFQGGRTRLRTTKRTKIIEVFCLEGQISCPTRIPKLVLIFVYLLGLG